jgi:hypothetical protein
MMAGKGPDGKPPFRPRRITDTIGRLSGGKGEALYNRRSTTITTVFTTPVRDAEAQLDTGNAEN